MNTDRWTLRGLLVALTFPGAACSSGPEEVEKTPQELAREAARQSGAWRKKRMMMATKSAITQLLGQASERTDAIRSQYEEVLNTVQKTLHLEVADPVLEQYGDTEWEVFRTQIDTLQEGTESALQELLDDYGRRFWGIAESAAQRERGSEVGTRSGYQELDDVVEASLAQLERQADVEGVDQLARTRKSQRVALGRKIKHEVEGLGKFLLFVSAPEDVRDLPVPSRARDTSGFERIDQSIACVAAFHRSDEAMDTPLRLVQAVRYRVERGGVILEETEWKFDPRTGDENGVVPLGDVGDPAYLASQPMVPLIERESAGFAALHNHTLVAEYRLRLENAVTGEEHATLAWQAAWLIDYRGQLRVDFSETEERVVEDDLVISDLRAAQLLSHAETRR